MKTERSILKKPANEIAEKLNLDLHSKRFKFLDYAYAIIYSGIHTCDLTECYNNNISHGYLKFKGSREIPYTQAWIIS